MVLPFKHLGGTIVFDLKCSEQQNSINKMLRLTIKLFYFTKFVFLIDQSYDKFTWHCVTQFYYIAKHAGEGDTNRTAQKQYIRSQKIILKVAYSLPLTFPTSDLFDHTSTLTIYKL